MKIFHQKLNFIFEIYSDNNCTDTFAISVTFSTPVVDSGELALWWFTTTICSLWISRKKENMLTFHGCEE